MERERGFVASTSAKSCSHLDRARDRERCIEGVRWLDTPSVVFQGAAAARLLARTADGADRVVLYGDNHLRPYTGQHTAVRCGG